MALTAGVLSQVSVSSNTDQLASTAASGGTGPYTQQWYRSTTTGFSPGGGNIIAGATALTLNDSGLIPNTTYYYKVVYTDTGNSNATVTATQLAVVTTAQALSPNQFNQTAVLGQLDLPYNYNTIAAEIDVTQSGTIYAGQAVKVIASAGGIPKVVAIAANSDDVFGFINYDIKTVGFVAGSVCEISQAGNVMFLYASAAINRGTRVTVSIVSPGTVDPLVGSSGADIVGFAIGQASAAGNLIRIKLLNPSFQKA